MFAARRPTPFDVPRLSLPDRHGRCHQADDLDTLNIKQLKALARDNGVSLDGCAEKTDIIDRSALGQCDYRRNVALVDNVTFFF